MNSTPWRRAVAGLVLTSSVVLAGLVPSAVLAARPDVVQGTRSTAAIPTGSSFGTLGTLHVGSGTWLVTATWTVRIDTPFGVRPRVVCDLRAEEDAGLVDLHVTRTDRWAGSFSGDRPMSSGMESIVGAELDASGQVRLRCHSDLDGTSAQRIRIVALKVPSLGHAQAGSGSTATIADGTAPTLVAGAGGAIPTETWSTLASVTLPAGHWWLHGVATIRDKTNSGAFADDGAECRLSLGAQQSGADLRTFTTGDRVQTWDLATATTAARGGRVARVRCYGTGLDMRLVDLRIVAWPLGRLSTWRAGAETMSTEGTGDQVAIHGIGTTTADVPSTTLAGWTHVIDIPIPAGRWLAKAVFLTDGHATSDAVEYTRSRMECVLDGGADEDTARFPQPVEEDRPSMTAIVDHVLPGTATLRCTSPGAPATSVGQVRELRATLLKIGSVTTRPLD